MDVSFEIVKKLNTLNKQAAFKRLDKETGFIYFDEAQPFNFATKKIPFIENLAYVLALFNNKSVEDFHLGEKNLKKLLCFYKEGNFSRYLHEFPLLESPYIGVFAYPYFYQIIKNFKAYLQVEVYEKLEIIQKQIKENIKNLSIYHHLEPLIAAIFDQPIKQLYYSFESAYAFMISKKENLPEALMSQEIKFIERGHLMLSLFDFLKWQSLDTYPPYVNIDHPLHLKLSLLYEPFEKKQIKPSFFQEPLFQIGYKWQQDNLNEHVMTFDHNVKIARTKKGMVFEGLLQLQEEFGLYFPRQMQITQAGEKGTYFLKDQPILIEGLGKSFKIHSSAPVVLEYQKRKQELFNDSCLALKNQSSGSFTIELEII